MSMQAKGIKIFKLKIRSNSWGFFSCGLFLFVLFVFYFFKMSYIKAEKC